MSCSEIVPTKAVHGLSAEVMILRPDFRGMTVVPDDAPTYIKYAHRFMKKSEHY